MRTSFVLAITLCGVFAKHIQGVTILSFEGLQQDEFVRNYYNGGFGSTGSGPGPDYGISWAPANGGALARIDVLSGFSGEPSPPTAIIGLPIAILNSPAGFDTGFSFFYSSIQTGAAGPVVVYDGLNATGNVLATLNLPPTDPMFHRRFLPIGVSFDGIARSVFLPINAIYDDITIGSATPGIPEPGTYAMVTTGLVALVLAARRKRSRGPPGDFVFANSPARGPRPQKTLLSPGGIGFRVIFVDAKWRTLAHF